MKWLIGLAVAAAGLLAWGDHRWRSYSATLGARLEAGRMLMAQNPDTGSPRYDAGGIGDLPAPVQRYFRAALRDGQPLIAAADIAHEGTFNMSEKRPQWRRFTSRQRVIVNRPGFDWEARIAMMPGLKVRVHDAYIAGEGILRASLFGLITMADAHGQPELARGELTRYLAEAAWYPTALLPASGVRWEPVDDASAMAILKDGEIVASLLFRFNAEGLIASVRSENRGRGVGDSAVPTPWEGRFHAYETRDGMRIPMEGEVAWLLPEGYSPYWRGRIVDIRYAFDNFPIEPFAHVQ